MGEMDSDSDPAFTVISKTKPGFFIWRVENFKLVAVPREAYSIFFKGDTYVIYHAEEVRKSSINIHIHFWIGVESTQDEAGVAAYKTVELDDYLSGITVQHREVQGNESEQFLSYFKSRGGLTYRIGGISNGFNRYEKSVVSRLYRLKGRHNVRLNEMASIDWSQMNHSDIFLIDLYDVIYLWNGNKSNKYERLQAIQRAKQLKDERASLI
ncbi:unnamed protein product, partial [Didymodactylos carnosus]